MGSLTLRDEAPSGHVTLSFSSSSICIYPESTPPSRILIISIICHFPSLIAFVETAMLGPCPTVMKSIQSVQLYKTRQDGKKRLFFWLEPPTCQPRESGTESLLQYVRVGGCSVWPCLIYKVLAMNRRRLSLTTHKHWRNTHRLVLT